jgi:hypothetical protein
MARDTWFETVAIAQQRAKKRLPKSVYSALISASEKGLTVSDNVEAFGELGFAPHGIGALKKRELATTVMGQELSLPVMISPTGVQAVHPDGEVAVARAAARRWGCRRSPASPSKRLSPPTRRCSSRSTGQLLSVDALQRPHCGGFVRKPSMMGAIFSGLSSRTKCPASSTI